MPEIVRERAPHAVVADLHHPRAVAGARASPRRAAAARACARCAPPRRAPTGRAARAPTARRPPRCPGRARCRARGARRRSRSSSSANVVSVAGALRPSGRCSARRRSRSAACSSTVTRSRASRGQRRVARDDQQHAEQPLDHALVHLAREVDPLLQLARASLLEGRVARGLGQRGGLAERPEQVALLVGQRAPRAAVGEDHAAPAPARRERAADERRVVEQVAEGLGHLARDRLGVHLDHAVLLERLARDRRRLHGHARVREAVEVEPVCARGAHAPVRLVVAEDHRAVHRREPADRLAERRVEAVGGPVGLRRG